MPCFRFTATVYRFSRVLLVDVLSATFADKEFFKWVYKKRGCGDTGVALRRRQKA